MVGYIPLIAFLVVVPFGLGALWTLTVTRVNKNRILLALPLGYFIEIALFQVLEFPFAILHGSFSTLCYIFAALLVVLFILSLVFLYKKKIFHINRIKMDRWVVVYGIIFLIITCFQIVMALTMDRTYMSHDDAYYVAVANDAIYNDVLFMHNADTGIMNGLDIRRSMQASIVFPAFLTRITSIPLELLEHTILDVYYLILAYSVYAYMGFVLFKKTEDSLIFLIILSVLYIFGNYTIYSPSMRLQGLNYVGKAIVAVIFFPLLFSILIEALEREYNRGFTLLLMILSIAASAQTLFGSVMMIVNLFVVIMFNVVRKQADRKNCLYLLFGSFFPIIFIGGFFVVRFLP